MNTQNLLERDIAVMFGAEMLSSINEDLEIVNNKMLKKLGRLPIGG